MSGMRGCTLLLGTLLACSFHQTAGYGFLHTPMSRGTVGYPKPIDPNHKYNYCEVFDLLPGYFPKCGVCGDKLNRPRDHEVGGKYATGNITASYKSGATIPVKVHLDAKQLGWIEFRLCPVSNPSMEVTQDCLNQNLLKFADGTTRRAVRANENEIEMKVQLPDSVTCSHCVLQWKYRTGAKVHNCWYDKTIFECGVQEYYNCADVSISGTSSLLSNPAPKTDPVTKPVTNPATRPVTKPVTQTVTEPVTLPATKPVTQPVSKLVTQPVTKPVTQQPVTKPATQPVTKPVTQPATKLVTTPTVVRSTEAKPVGKCVPIGNWVNQPGMHTWCVDNCAQGYCPSNMCAC